MEQQRADFVAAENWDLIIQSLDRLSEGITIIDSADNLVLYNTQAAEYLGIDKSEIGVGVSLHDLTSKQTGKSALDPGSLLMQQLDASREGKPQFFERELKGGRILSVRANPIPGGGVITLYTDITERKAFEKRLIDMATRDELTGLVNRREFFTLAHHEEERAKREGHVVSVMMVDADYFKKINDTYGHATGDDVLRNLADNCRKIFRKTDVVGRYGGEEFSVVLPGAEEDMAKIIAERLRSSVADSVVESDKGDVTYTISIGIACAVGKDVRIEELLDRADRALYTAKAQGRNRAVFDAVA
ncbi:MAG: diguanylate cyclase [Rhodospirillales bacterium]|nr:diguanylate cyclase [Rhodospirillales bacterium]MBO6786440.1 diguanylate cyclase [Rhodospirillales bacterium]